MKDTERLLEEAGERWRASQRDVPEIDPARLVSRRSRSPSASLYIAAAMGVAAVLVAGATIIQLGTGSSTGGQSQGSAASWVASVEASNSGKVAGQTCAVTLPGPVLVPPPPAPASPPRYYGSEWFGSPALWTMIERDGEIWKQSSLPHNPEGLTQKSFWWSVDWQPDSEPQPAITVVGTRLDGSGDFRYGDGTNASADFGTAMLVGVDFPSPGCWQLTGRYRDAELSYVIWITDD